MSARERVARYRIRHRDRLRQESEIKQAMREPAERPRRGSYVAVELIDPRTAEPFWVGVARASDAPVWSRLLGRRSPAGKRLAAILEVGLEPMRSRWLPGWAMAQQAAARLAAFRASQATAWGARLLSDRQPPATYHRAGGRPRIAVVASYPDGRRVEYVSVRAAMIATGRHKVTIMRRVRDRRPDAAGVRWLIG